MDEQQESCVKPSKGPLGIPKTDVSALQQPIEKGVATMIAKVGKPAPDFEASAFINGGFKNITLSEFKGKWVVLCFYPGDFTFV
jgi:peroxiredoxin (alkyl hydroperoxide reductase subunit C)